MRKEAILISSSPWKGSDWREKMETRGVLGSVLSIKCHAQEPNKRCAYEIGVGKPQMFVAQLGEASGLIGKRVATVDINGLIPRGKNKKPMLVTTGRGVMTGVDKSFDTVLRMQNNMRGRGGRRGGAIVFENICGTAVVEKDGMRDIKPFVESARLTLSKPLLGFLSNISNLRRMLEWGDERPIINEKSSGGIDFTILHQSFPDIQLMMGITGLWIMLETQDGCRMMADESGVEEGMEERLNSLLRGITNLNADRVAAIC